MRRRYRQAVLVAAAVALAAAAPYGVSRAQAPGQSLSTIAQLPDLETYRVQVYGDSLADGLQGGLADAFSDEPRLKLQQRARAIPSLFRGDLDDVVKAIETETGREPPQIAVLMLGVNDRVPLRAAYDRRVRVGSDEWRGEYGRRLDKLMRLFRARSIPVYWVGLPIMRRQDISEESQMISGVARERSLVNGIRFIDVQSSFADVDGAFTPYGSDVTGKNRLLRDQDGVHFTAAGYRKLAFFVDREIRRDIARARAEKPIALAGDEGEQKRIRPVKASAEAGPGRAASVAGRGGGRLPETAEGDIPQDDGRVTLRFAGARGAEEQTVTLDILRPAIPAAVVSIVTRRETVEKGSQHGDPVMTEIAGGATVVSTITPSGEAGQDRRQESPTSSLFYRVLVKGERLAPRPGRSDDLPWPRAEVLPPAPAAPVAASAQGSRNSPVPASPPAKTQPRR